MQIIENIKEKTLIKHITGNADRKLLSLGNIDSYKKILFVSEEERESYKSTVQKFFPKSKVHHLYLRPIKTDRTIGHNYSIHESDFNIAGKLKNDKLRLLRKTNFDLILDLTESSVYLNYFIYEIPSKLIIGRIDAENSKLHDLYVEYGTNDDEFLTNITNQIALLTENGDK